MTRSNERKILKINKSAETKLVVNTFLIRTRVTFNEFDSNIDESSLKIGIFHNVTNE